MSWRHEGGASACSVCRGCSQALCRGGRAGRGRQDEKPATPAVGPALPCSAWNGLLAAGLGRRTPLLHAVWQLLQCLRQAGEELRCLQVPVGAMASHFGAPLSFVGFFAGSPWSQGLDKGQHSKGSEFSVSVSLSRCLSVSLLCVCVSVLLCLSLPPTPLGLRTRILHIQEAACAALVPRALASLSPLGPALEPGPCSPPTMARKPRVQHVRASAHLLRVG